jgi:fumarate hydratase subunit alpha
MRDFDVAGVRDAIAAALTESASRLPGDYLASLGAARRAEETAFAREVIDLLLDNARYAADEGIATCQDTGMAILFVEIGQDVHFIGGTLSRAIEEGVRRGYAPLRKSVVGDPLLRKNTGDNTPAIVHYDIVAGDRVRITILMKGFGAEMMSRMTMLVPAAGVAGVKSYVIDAVKAAGPNACPPLIVGVGLGSSFDGVGLLAKKALCRPLGSENPSEHLARLEAELLAEINALGIGPQAFGGATTALAVHVESAATHIAALPVAVNFNCSAPLRATISL